MHRDAGIAGAQDGVHAVVAADRSAAGTRLAFVARRRQVVEIGAACALQEIAADGRHVAQLLRGACHDRARKHRIAPLDQRVVGEIGVAHERADAKAAAGRLLHFVQGKLGDVDQLGRPLDVHLHEIDKIGATGNEFCAWACGHEAHRIRDVAGTRILEADHDGRPITCWMAATMLV